MAGSSATAAPGTAPDEAWLDLPRAGHAVLTIDATGVVISGNSAARRLFAMNPDGHPIHAAELFGPPVGAPGGGHALFDGLAATPGRPPAWTGNLTCFRGPGQPFVVTATAARDPAGGLVVICGPPPAPNAPSWLPPDLSRRIGHELRGSLTGIAGLAAIMARRAAAGSGEELRRLRMIERNARTGIATVDRVVELTQLESGRIRCHQVAADTGQILAAAIGMSAATAGPGQRVLAESTADLRVHTDPAYAKAIVAELITNALVAGAAAQVRLRAVARADATLIEVTDDGRGIALDEQRTVFDPFVRGESAADGAVGLGLHLARRQAHLIGAELSLLSNPGHGCIFTLALPAATRQQVAAPAGTVGSGE